MLPLLRTRACARQPRQSRRAPWRPWRGAARVADQEGLVEAADARAVAERAGAHVPRGHRDHGAAAAGHVLDGPDVRVGHAPGAAVQAAGGAHDHLLGVERGLLPRARAAPRDGHLRGRRSQLGGAASLARSSERASERRRGAHFGGGGGDALAQDGRRKVGLAGRRGRRGHLHRLGGRGRRLRHAPTAPGRRV
eukprot:scaffold1121_cov317-Prasinococcus_capsulatus_cf.AAC.4